MFLTPDGNYRSRSKKKTYYKNTCSCGNIFLGAKEQVFCSPSCSMSDPKVQKKYKESMKKAHGVEYNFQKNEIRIKSQKEKDQDAEKMMKYDIDYYFVNNPPIK